MNYAIKTSQGYFATQGHTHWFESEPVGWALYSTRENAAEVLEANSSIMGEVVEVSETPRCLNTTNNMKTSIDIRRDFPSTKTETKGKAGLYTCKVTREDIGEIVGYGCTLAGAEDTAWYGVKITLRDHSTALH